MGPHAEFGARSSHLGAFGVDGDGEADRRCRLVRHVDMDTKASFARVEMGAKQLHAGPFHEPDHEAGGKHLRHGGELGRLLIKMRHRLAHRNRVGEGMLEPRLQCRLHGLASFSARGFASPAFSSPGIAVSMPSHGLRKSKLRNSCISFTGSYTTRFNSSS